MQGGESWYFVPMNKRPNKNPILDSMRDSDTHDMWGTAMAWAFACNENLAAIGEDASPHFRPSPFGACIESYEDFRVQESLENGEVTVAEVQFAAKCLDRYTTWLDMAGLSY